MAVTEAVATEPVAIEAAMLACTAAWVALPDGPSLLQVLLLRYRIVRHPCRVSRSLHWLGNATPDDSLARPIATAVDAAMVRLIAARALHMPTCWSIASEACVHSRC